MTPLRPAYVRSVVEVALAEDIGSGDITTQITVPEQVTAKAELVAKADGVLAGIDIARAAFGTVDPRTVFEPQLEDGAELSEGRVIAVVEGRARSLLTAERVALNFLQRMCGVATMTARYVRLVSHTQARIVDTRKTTPGLRALEKYAVTVGGGRNHRFGLYDGILIKDNHIAAAGGVGSAVAAARAKAPHTLKVEVEVTNLDELREAIDSGADAVLLDNMPIEMLREAVKVSGGLVVLEASGGITLENVAAVAETGVDLISVGALTHSAPALDISLDFLPSHSERSEESASAVPGKADSSRCSE